MSNIIVSNPLDKNIVPATGIQKVENIVIEKMNFDTPFKYDTVEQCIKTIELVDGIADKAAEIIRDTVKGQALLSAKRMILGDQFGLNAMQMEKTRIAKWKNVISKLSLKQEAVKKLISFALYKEQGGQALTAGQFTELKKIDNAQKDHEKSIMFKTNAQIAQKAQEDNQEESSFNDFDYSPGTKTTENLNKLQNILESNIKGKTTAKSLSNAYKSFITPIEINRKYNDKQIDDILFQEFGITLENQRTKYQPNKMQELHKLLVTNEDSWKEIRNLLMKSAHPDKGGTQEAANFVNGLSDFFKEEDNTLQLMESRRIDLSRERNNEF